MFNFFLKKNFADGWDNIFYLCITNLFSMAVLGLEILFLGFGFADELGAFLKNVVFIFLGGLFMTVNFAHGVNAAKIANFDKGTFGSFFRAFTYVWKIGFGFGAFLTISGLIIQFGIEYYLGFKNMVGFFLVAIILWFTLISVISLQWFIPFYFLQGDKNGFKKCLKKSFMIFFDNPIYSILFFFYNIFLLAVSSISFFLIPGFAGITVSTTNALRLLLKKYDWLEEMEAKEPGFESNKKRRKNVPWKDLIADDVEELGPRNFLSYIFPWR